MVTLDEAKQNYLEQQKELADYEKQFQNSTNRTYKDRITPLQRRKLSNLKRIGKEEVSKLKNQLGIYEREQLIPAEAEQKEYEQNLALQEQETKAYEAAKTAFEKGISPYWYSNAGFEGKIKYYLTEFWKQKELSKLAFNKAIKEIQDSLPKGEKLIIRDGQIVGVESEAFQQSLDLDSYNKRIDELNKQSSSVDFAGSAGVVSLPKSFSSGLKENLLANPFKKESISNTLNFVAGSIASKLSKNRYVIKTGPYSTKNIGVNYDITYNVLRTAPYFNEAGAYIFLTETGQALVTEAGKKRLKDEYENKIEKGTNPSIAFAEVYGLEVGKLVLGYYGVKASLQNIQIKNAMNRLQKTSNIDRTAGIVAQEGEEVTIFAKSVKKADSKLFRDAIVQETSILYKLNLGNGQITGGEGLSKIIISKFAKEPTVILNKFSLYGKAGEASVSLITTINGVKQTIPLTELNAVKSEINILTRKISVSKGGNLLLKRAAEFEKNIGITAGSSRPIGQYLYETIGKRKTSTNKDLILTKTEGGAIVRQRGQWTDLLYGRLERAKPAKTKVDYTGKVTYYKSNPKKAKLILEGKGLLYDVGEVNPIKIINVEKDKLLEEISQIKDLLSYKKLQYFFNKASKVETIQQVKSLSKELNSFVKATGGIATSSAERVTNKLITTSVKSSYYPKSAYVGLNMYERTETVPARTRTAITSNVISGVVSGLVPVSRTRQQTSQVNRQQIRQAQNQQARQIQRLRLRQAQLLKQRQRERQTAVLKNPTLNPVIVRPPRPVFSLVAPVRKVKKQYHASKKKRKGKRGRKYNISPTLGNLLYNSRRKTPLKESTGFEVLRL